jgi:peptide/nickel transport system substrate-binding protein
MINNAGFSDWVSAVNVIQSELKAVGIKVTPDNLSGSTYSTDVSDGKFQLAYDWDTGGPTPYYEMRSVLYSANTAKVGSAAPSNYERYSNAATDTLLEDYAGTTNTAVQHSVIDQLENVMLTQLPVIPVTEQVDWYQYDTQNIGGWVTASNPYAQPGQYLTPDWGVVLLHLYYK